MPPLTPPPTPSYSGSYLAFKNLVIGDYDVSDYISFYTIQQDDNCLATGSSQHAGGPSDIFSGYIMEDKLYYQEAFNSENVCNWNCEGVLSFSDSYIYAYCLEHGDGATDVPMALSGYFEPFTGTTEQLGIMTEYGFQIPG